MKKFLLILMLICCFALTDAWSQQIDVKTHTLKNGMKILVHEDKSIPNAAMYIFYRIGSRNERPGTTGLSHFFEHMMFNGAKKYGTGEFDRVMEAAGGTNNAYTNQNLTVYQDWFPTSALELIFDLESDRIADLSLDPKVIESERGVVYSERRNSVDNNNLSIIDEQLWATAFTAHPYQWPVVGWPSDIEKWTLADLKHHFEIGYSPSNATMVVTGAVKFEEIVKLAEKYIEPIKANPAPPPVTTAEPEQRGERRAKVVKFAQLPAVTIGYHIPQTTHPDYYALRALEDIILSGESSRLYRRLVDKEQIALSIFGGFDFAFDPTLFTFTAQPRAGITTRQVEKSLYDELERVKKDGVTTQELQKAKNIQIASFYGRLKTIAGKANTIGTYEVYFGDYRKLFSVPDEISKITVADIQRVAKQYFTTNNRTVITLVVAAPDAAAADSNKTDKVATDQDDDDE
jgi:zinc protease